MTYLTPPNLDDRRFADLLQEARDRIRQQCPEWTDLSPSDPGMVLLEAFAHLTEVMIYRLNRLPEKAYIEFLNLIGVRLQPPAAAVTKLVFSIPKPLGHAVEIPKGVRVTLGRAGSGREPPIFTTSEAVAIPAGSTSAESIAYHCDWVRGELAGKSDGQPGFFVNAKRPPIVAPNRDGLDLVVGVEAGADEIEDHTSALEYDGKSYIVWREAENFANPGSDGRVYLVDRLTGKIVFTPALRLPDPAGGMTPLQTLAQVPAAGREIRLWYRRGGGAEGNLAANTLNTLKDPIVGVAVTNPEPAAGGKAAETLENALIRGPQQIHSLERVVTARDYALLAVHCSGAANRAKAFTRADIWSHARPGTVEVLIVPNLQAPDDYSAPLTAEQLYALESEEARLRIQNALAERRPLGTECQVSWARYKNVTIRTQIVTHREEDPQQLKQRLLRKLYRGINPIEANSAQPWPFGQPLRVFDVYKILGDDPGVKSVNNVRLSVQHAPNANVGALCADAFQSKTWYTATPAGLFRSSNDGEGWELIEPFAGEKIDAIKAWPKQAGADPKHAGLLAISSRLLDSDGASRVRVSLDCGESWLDYVETNFLVEDMAWVERDAKLALLLATEKGLFELGVPWDPAAGPKPVQFDAEDNEIPLYALAVAADASGLVSVALAAGNNRGIYLSNNGGRAGSFSAIGLKGELVRLLAVQNQGGHSYLWAGIGAPGADPGKGCFRWRLTGTSDNNEGWKGFQAGWQAGSCNGLAFVGEEVFAASQRLGVLSLNTNSAAPAWKAPDAKCGLPVRDVGRFQAVDAIAAAPAGKALLLCGGVEGLYLRGAAGDYRNCSADSFADTVTVPCNWLLCSGAHELEVVSEDETPSD
ncbi:putative baseplate assembly protein [Methylomonas sp. SURF-1]|uniref:Baseplate assembly protein n=1 Tax=Methylomonas aurea TaxID=2952224 RepID=A0ABT1UGX6_9GAMM|nr:putative baseplate assembly protein [Methylomonas sp. SURF-1]MCQ8180964.1 putative baseplate assembly protein [Methylomonas sp. SURF-1]